MTAPIPATIEEAISPDWLSAAVAERHPGLRILSVDEAEIVHAVAARARIRVTYAGPGADRLPTQLFVKGGFAPDTAHLLAGGAYYREARFYRELAPSLGEAGVPLCLHASVDEASRQGVVVLEDLPAGGATLYRLGDTHDVATAGKFVDALARLHATSFGDAAWVPLTANVVPRLIRNDPLALLTAHITGERGEAMPARLRDPELVLAALEALLATAAEPPLCLLHGDMHLGNIFGTADGRPGWYDWQTLQRGCWAMDLVYYLVGSLAVADRQEHLPALLARYRAALAGAGGPVIDADEAAALYRRYLAYGLFIWSVARETIVPLAILKPLLHRFATAADEADTVAALRV